VLDAIEVLAEPLEQLREELRRVLLLEPGEVGLRRVARRPPTACSLVVRSVSIRGEANSARCGGHHRRTI
jgi:hypothetical protein